MEDASKKHQELTKKLIEVIDEFHKDNPSLFVEDIKIHYGENPLRRKLLRGVEVNITVQP